MKNYILILLILFTQANELWGQQKTIDIDLERNESIESFLDLGSNGFILKTGKAQTLSKDVNWVARHYSPNLDLLWEVNIPKTEVTKNLSSPVISSPKGDYVYQIENKGGIAVWSKGGMYVSQIDQAGKLRGWEIDPKKLKDLDVSHFSGNGLQFCTESYFYLMSSPSNISIEKEANYVFYRWDHKGWQAERKEIILPDFKPAADRAYFKTWRFLGQSKGKLYFSGSSTTGQGGKQIRVFIVGIDEVSLQVEKELTVDLSLDNGKFIYPYNNIIVAKEPTNSGNHSFDGFDINTTVSSSTRMDPNFGAYVRTILDEVHGHIYLVGYYGNMEFQSNITKPDYQGYYIQKYNLSGDLLWKVQKVAPPALVAERIFDMTSYSFHHLLFFRVEEDESVSLSLSLRIPKSPAFVEKYSSGGEPIGSYRYPYKGDVNRDLLMTSYTYHTHQGAKSLLTQLPVPLMATAIIYGGKDSFVLITQNQKESKIQLHLF